MTSRRERQPTGRSNFSARDDGTLAPIRGALATDRSSSNQNSARNAPKSMYSPIKRAQTSGDQSSSSGGFATFASNSTGAMVLKEMKEKQLEANEGKYATDKARLGPYNKYSTPIPSRTIAPLRSALMDPSVNNFVPSKTRTQLLERIQARCEPHDSYDVDGDGWVSPEDYCIAKQFDLGRDGILDPDERKLAKQVVVEQFLEKNDSGLRALGALGGRSKLIEHTLRDSAIVADMSLPQTMSALSQAKLALRNSTRDLLCPWDQDAAGTKTQRFFTNKLDATAWNDFDTVPRHTLSRGLEDHGGSRRRLLFTRKQKHTIEAHTGLEQANAEKPRLDARRFCIITNPANENA